ncbi:MAG: peptidase M48 Ste24p [Pseudomonadota bacterium]|nr:peptidase M48 Ste24p [Pseudomonadota bacterium]
MNIHLTPSSVTKFMVSLIAVLTVMHLTQMGLYYYIDDRDVFTWIKLIDFGYEANLPSIYSVMAIAFSGLLLALITTHHKRLKQPYYAWLGLTLIFLFLALDEGASIHEKIGDFTEDNIIDASGYFYYEWVIPYAIFVTLFVVGYLSYLFSLPKKIAIQFVIAGTIFLSGAVGLEMLSAQEADTFNTNTVTYSVLYTTEELLEMIGIVVFVNALLKYIQSEIGSIQFTLSTSSNEENNK